MLKNVKITTKFNLLNLIAPLSCRVCGKLGEPLCNRCKNYNIRSRQNLCPNCKGPNQTGYCRKCENRVPIYVYDYKQNLIGTLVHDYKYSCIRTLGKTLAELLDQILPELPQNTVIVPLPTSTKHIRERGFDHALVLAKQLAKIRGLKVERLLVRNKNTVQVGTDAKTRKIQAKHAFKISQRYLPSPEKTYLLLDDVWTTGASMEAAVSQLQAAGAKKIVVAVLALTSDQNHTTNNTST